MRRALVLLFVLLAACSGNDKGASTTSSTGDEQANARVEGIPAQGRALEPVSEGKVTVCIDVPNPPFALDENGRTAGVDAEVMRALGGRLGLAAEFRVTPPASLFKDLDGGRCDLVASAVPKSDPEATARTASAPYLEPGTPGVTDRYVFVMPKGADDFKKAIDEALRAIRRDDTYSSIIRRYFGATS